MKKRFEQRRDCKNSLLSFPHDREIFRSALFIYTIGAVIFSKFGFESGTTNHEWHHQSNFDYTTASTRFRIK